MRILFVTLGAPWPLDRGARVRDFELIRRVGQVHDVSLLALVPPPERPAALAEIRRNFAVETVALPGAPARHPLAAARQLARGRPAAALPYLSEDAMRRVGVLARERAVDLVQLEHSFLAPYVDAVPRGCSTVLSLHNVGLRQYERLRRAEANPLAAAGYLAKRIALRRLELSHAPRFDRLIVVSEPERDALLAADPALRAEVIENGVDTRRLQMLPPPTEAGGILFVGNFGYPPNVDAVLHFGSRVMPLIRRRMPSATLTVVGPQAPARVRRMGRSEAVEVKGAVAELETAYRRATISVAPLLAAGGSRLKILESMAFGRCVVSTSLGAEGLPFRDGEELMIADDPHPFAEKALELLVDGGRRSAMSASARRAVERRHDWDTIAQRLLGVYARLAEERGDG